MTNGTVKTRSADTMANIGKTKITNRNTGEVKEIALATQKQVDYLRYLEHANGMVVHNHTSKTVWQAGKRITQLKEKLDKETAQTKIV